MGPEAQEAIGFLKEGLQDSHAPCRSLAAIALGELGASAKVAIPELRKALGDNDESVRNQAALALANIGAEAITILREMLKDEDWAVRLMGVQAMAFHGPDAAIAVQDLARLLGDDVADVRAGAASALAALGPAAKDAVPELLKAMTDGKLEVQLAAFQALKRVNANDAPELVKAFSKLNQDHHWAAPYVLKQFGPAAKDAVKPLIKQLEGKLDGERMGAALALGEIGIEAIEAVPALQKARKDANPQVQHSAAIALALIKADNDAPSAALKDVLPAYEKNFKEAQAQWQIQQKAQGFEQVAHFNLLRPVNRQALINPQIQATYDSLVGLHVMLSVRLGNSCRAKMCETTEDWPVGVQPLVSQVTDAIRNLEQESVPALIKGIHLWAFYDLGFT
jgi:HEAT repeat protein